MRQTKSEASMRRYDRWHRRDPSEPNMQSNESVLGMMALRTQQEVANMLGISRQAVHQLERRAIKKLRQGLANYRKEFMASQ